MFNSIAHFERTWSQEMKFTQKVMAALSDKSLSQTVADDHRTLGRMAWHIVTSVPEMASHIDLKLDGPDPKAPVPATAAEVSRAYKQVSESLLNSIKSAWDDATMLKEDDLYGETWKRGQTLHILMLHEIHHRGQMTVLMRQADVKVPNIYGPALEGWAEYGTPPPEI
jgi:uncharacterized damage-inducible protein DinB